MASTSVNVLRWSALGLGAIYGLTRQMSFNQEAKVNAEKRAYEHKQELINKAKAEFEAKQNPSKGDGIIRNPEDKNFDLEKYLNAVFAENK